MNSSVFIIVISTILGGGMIGALIQAWLAKPQRDSVVVTTAQNASAILQGLNESIYEELKRERVKREAAEAELEALKKLLTSPVRGESHDEAKEKNPSE